ncbi:hypothetical protein [Dyella subtropica]|nr:hypothetical protein [Dyella subtropica]
MPTRRISILKSCLGLAVFLLVLGVWLASDAHAQVAQPVSLKRSQVVLR